MIKNDSLLLQDKKFYNFIVFLKNKFSPPQANGVFIKNL